MEKEDYEKITVIDITKRAGVSRMSYYRIYQSKDDIIETHLIEVFEEMHPYSGTVSKQMCWNSF